MSAETIIGIIFLGPIVVILWAIVLYEAWVAIKDKRP
jgi:hypothetical protein